jgi:RNA polymerase primary sigma factor
MKQETQDKNAVSSYLDALHHFPQLKHPELVELFKTYNAGRTKIDDDKYELTPDAAKVRAKLIECNLRLVVSIAKQYKGHNIPIEDLIQEGNIGLMKSIERFDWKRGYRFSTYSTWWIKQAIGQHVLKRKRMIRLPAHAATVQRKLLQAAEEYRDSMKCEPTAEELQALIGASETVVRATMHSGRGTISLQQPMSASGEGDSIEDRVEDERPGADPFENVAEKQLLEITKRVLNGLSAKEAAILRLRFGLVEDATDSKSYPITSEEMTAVMQGKGLK